MCLPFTQLNPCHHLATHSIHSSYSGVRCPTSPCVYITFSSLVYFLIFHFSFLHFLLTFSSSAPIRQRLLLLQLRPFIVAYNITQYTMRLYGGSLRCGRSYCCDVTMHILSTTLIHSELCEHNSLLLLLLLVL